MTTDSESPKRQETNPIQENLERQFQQLGGDMETPEDLKTEVFKTMDTLALFGDVLDLFTVKFSEAEAQLLDVTSPDNLEEGEAANDATPEESMPDNPNV